MDFDVIIIGSGPAGAMAAIESTKAGLHTAILEKEALPRRKVCAGGLVKRTLQLIPQDLEFPVESRCHTVELQVHNLKQSFKETRENLVTMINRVDFDYALVKYAMNKGASVIDNTAVERLIPHDNHVEVVSSGKTYTAAYVVLAEGANARIANNFWNDERVLIPAMESEITLPPEKLDEFKGVARFDFDILPTGYGWVFPKSDHISVGIGSFSQKDNHLPKSFAAYKETVGLDGAYEERHKRGFIIPVKPRKPPYMKQRMILVGDAAGFADPITAEGFTYALKSGLEAGKALAHGKNSAEVFELYHQGIEKEIVQELAIASKLSQSFYYSHTIRNAVFRKYGQRLCNGMVNFIEGKNNYQETVARKPMFIRLFMNM